MWQDWCFLEQIQFLTTRDVKAECQQQLTISVGDCCEAELLLNAELCLVAPVDTVMFPVIINNHKYRQHS